MTHAASAGVSMSSGAEARIRRRRRKTTTTFTPERAGAAVRAGVASVLNGLTGIVIWLH